MPRCVYEMNPVSIVEDTDDCVHRRKYGQADKVETLDMELNLLFKKQRAWGDAIMFTDDKAETEELWI